ncbi:acetyltransferase [Flavobacterium sp. LS1R49]|uniref:Acetyltransferase n=1 Tax=Flavobacterium shii TaxID=2987687 RepID=A0A9X2ZDJ9_9FLAO|nr:GNAT family N-acetyltransferase [Flavobacterium shii]MCV9928625.1 acetyltransferase [Flavobacterium shii]
MKNLTLLVDPNHNQHIGMDFTKHIPSLGDIHLRQLNLDTDIDFLHQWVTKPYATYWGMEKFSIDEVKAAYQEIAEMPSHDAYIGILNDKPIFLMERYLASNDLIANYYDAHENDFGMHILVGPPEHQIPNFTWNVFSTIMDFIFTNDSVNRIVVEPDTRNEKIHTLNKRAGFVYHKVIELPHKTAHLAFCTKDQYQEALAKEQKNNQDE